MNDFELSTKDAQMIIIQKCKRDYSMSAVRQLIYRSKKLRAKKILGRIMISRSSLQKLIKAKVF